MSTTTDSHVVVSRFPYFGQEYLTFILGGVIAGGLAYLLAPMPVVSGTAAFILGAMGCFYMSWSRKESSKVTVTLTDGYLTVQSTGKVGDGAVHIPDVISISDRKVGASECFILREESNAKGEKVYLNLPTRVLNDKTLYDLIGRVIADLPESSRSVKAAYADLPTPK